jgi:chaperonin GroEL (HSP60 family)
MNQDQILSLETVLKQLESYNNNFAHYFACLTTVNYEIKELTSHFRRIANINLAKPRSQKSKAHIAKIFKDAMKTNNKLVESLETEIKNLTQIVSYLNEQKPKIDLVTTAVSKAKNNFSDADVRKNAIKIVANAKKLNNNLDLCKNYILPKNQAILEERKGLHTRLEYKYQMLHYSSSEQVIA